MHKKIYYSLPVQLFILNLKRNRLILMIWILLFAIATNRFAQTYGVPYLFLDPEYIGKVNFWSLFSVGMSFGIFSMSYHITIYLLESYRFQFLMIKHDPFSKFCLNNSIFPATFLLVYMYSFIDFQLEQGGQDYYTIFKELAGFLLGFHITLILTFLYFRLTGYKIFKGFTQSLNNTLAAKKISRVNVIQKIKMIKRKNYHVDFYLDYPFVVKKVIGFVPYDKALITKVIDQNHMNAFLYQLTGFVLILIMGYFRDYSYLQLPAGASIFILGSLIVMLMGAFSFWLKGWSLYVIIGVVLVTNFAIQTNLINSDYQAFGLNYNAKPAEYSLDRIIELSNKDNYKTDYQHMLQMLDRWKSKFSDTAKPKMILICTSGGGQRAAVWTMRTMQVADSILKGKLLNNTFCISGASGGLIGASYYRELYLRKQLYKNIEPTDGKYFVNMTKDILNPVVFSLIVNDIFFRFETFRYGKYSYTKDRGYAFERQLDKNTEGFMNKKVTDYGKYEEQSIIPMVLLTPSVVNDSRKLYISPQPLSYMNTTDIEHADLFPSKVKGIEFMRFFKDQDAENLSFLSGLRMSATFPYITPNVNLPSDPSMEVMDAGLTDNYGIVEAVRFSFIFRKWIKENTSGVVFLCIRDSPKLIPIEKKPKNSIVGHILNPIGTLYSNWDWIQDNNDEYFLEYAKNFLGKMDIVEFQYSPVSTEVNDKTSKKERDEMQAHKWRERASLNWHLTKKEKESLRKTIYSAPNLKSLTNLSNLIEK